MAKKEVVQKTLKIPTKLFERVLDIHEKEGRNLHALLLELLEEGVEAHVAGNARQKLKDIKRQVSHMGAELDAIFKRK